MGSVIIAPGTTLTILRVLKNGGEKVARLVFSPETSHVHASKQEQEALQVCKPVAANDTSPVCTLQAQLCKRLHELGLHLMNSNYYESRILRQVH